MRAIILVLLLLCGVSGAQAQTLTPEQRAQMQKAMEQMNSPEYRAQMQKAMESMKAAGMDPATVEGAARLEAAGGKLAGIGMEMQQCIEQKAGPDAMQKMQRLGEAHHAKVQALCAAGKKDDARSEAESFGKKMIEMPEYKGIRSCSDQYRKQLDDPALALFKTQLEAMGKVVEKRDVCGL